MRVRVMMPDTLVQDLRHGVRLLHRSPGFTVVALFALALGIGLNTAVFTAYKAMVTRSLDARDPHELVNIALTRPSGSARFQFSYPDYEAYRDSNRSFAGMIAFASDRMSVSEIGSVEATVGSSATKLGRSASIGTDVERASTFVVSENYFEVLGVPPARGRTFASIPVAELLLSPPVLISDNYLQKRFAGDTSILGRTIRLNGLAVTIIGITPRNFVGTGPAVPDFWMPVNLMPLTRKGDNWLVDRENETLRLFGRLRAGVTMAQAQAEISILASRVQPLHDPNSESAKSAAALVWPGSPFPLPMAMYPGVNVAILLVMLASAMVLVVACANVGSLQLARSRSRQDELQTRLSIGATRGRIARQLLTESTVLGLVAGLIALGCTWALLRVAVTVLANALPREFGTLIFHVTPDAATFAFVLAISLIATLLFGLTPALESSRTAIVLSARGSTSPARGRRMQDVFLTAQVALSLVLLIAGAMLIRSSMNAIQMDPGYESTRLISIDLRFPESRQFTEERRDALVRQVRGRLASLSGVSAVTSARAPGDSRLRTPAVPVESAGGMVSQQSLLNYSYVQPGYFEAVGIPLLLGRPFAVEGGHERSIILSDSAAKSLWPGRNPVGLSVRLGLVDEKRHLGRELLADGGTYEVLGIVKDIRGTEFDGSNSRHVYLFQDDRRLQTYPIIVRTAVDPAQIISGIDPIIASVDRELSATSLVVHDLLRQSGPFIVSSLSASVASVVGLFGLVLASMGIHGTVGYVVAQRTREVGIRMALGAQKRDVLSLILRESTQPVVVGLLLGVAWAVGASYLLRSVLFGLETVDPVSFLGVSALFLSISLLAAYFPARKASTVDPTVALRHD